MVALVIGFAEGDLTRPWNLSEDEPPDLVVLGRLAVAIVVLAVWAFVIGFVSLVIGVIVYWVLEHLTPSRIRAKRQNRLATSARLQAERDERERRDQELYDSIRIDVISVSNTEVVLSMEHTMPDLPDLQVLSVSYDVSFLDDVDDRVGWEYGQWEIYSWEHEENVKRRVLDDSEPLVTNCYVKVTWPRVVTL
jgi:hypothetical protein